MKTVEFSSQMTWISKFKTFQLSMFRRKSPAFLVVVGFLSALLVTGWAPAALGQLTFPTQTPSGDQQRSNRLPDRVERLGVLEVTPIFFENEVLFTIASPTIRDRGESGSQIPVELRAEQIESNLNRVIQDKVGVSTRGIENSTEYDLESLQVYVSILNNEPVLQVKDERHPQPFNLLTVTQADAEFYSLPIAEVAEFMRSRVDPALRQALIERSTETLRGRANRALLLLLATAIASLGLWLLQNLLRSRDDKLAVLQVSQSSKVATHPVQESRERSQPSDEAAFLDALSQQFSLDRRRSLLSFLIWIVTQGQIVVWIAGLVLILRMFPWTRQLSVQILELPIKLILLWFFAGLLNRAGDILLDRFSKVWGEYNIFGEVDAQRESLRVLTIVRILKGLKVFLIYLIALTWALDLVGVPVSSVLAIGGIIAFGISLGFQNVVKDVVTGCLILWEDQYAIGDVIAIGTDSGLVENMNLRITQLRNAQGELITIPNSSIVQVRNLTRSWSRVDFSIEVSYDADVDRSLELLREVAQQMYSETDWRTAIMEPPEVLGVDNLSYTGMLIRVWIKTQPGQQWRVGREFRRRVRLALAHQHITIGAPIHEFSYKNAPPFDEPSPDKPAGVEAQNGSLESATAYKADQSPKRSPT